jgi:ABC-type transport system involved in multi-copper enzyme maturation permease subunit
MSLISSEFRKVRFARAYRGLAFSAMGLAVLSCIASPYAVHSQAVSAAGLTMNGLDDPQVVSGMYAKSVAGYIVVVIMGVLLMAGEFRNRTAVATFLSSPRRSSVLAAKLVVAAIAGAATMAVAVALGSLACAVTLSQFPESVAPAAGTFEHLGILAVVSGSVLAVIGLAMGTLIRNQGLAIGITVVWLYIIDTLLVLFWPTGGKYLPSGLITGMMALHIEASDGSGSIGINTANYLDPTPAALMLLGYGAVFAGIAMATTMRRDID